MSDMNEHMESAFFSGDCLPIQCKCKGAVCPDFLSVAVVKHSDLGEERVDFISCSQFMLHSSGKSWQELNAGIMEEHCLLIPLWLVLLYSPGLPS